MSFALFLRNFHQQRATRLLKALLIADFLFILGHLFIVLFWNSEPSAFLIDAKGLGYPELFQYFKYILIMVLAGNLIRVKKEYLYLPFVALFFILFIDDAFQVHHKASWFLVSFLGLHTVIGVKAYVLGLLIYVAIMSFFVFGFITWFFLKGSYLVRKTFLDVFLLVFVFLLFGLGVDMVHNQLEDVIVVSFVLVLLEEGGEMIALSLLAWYFYFLIQGPMEKSDFLVHNLCPK